MAFNELFGSLWRGLEPYAYWIIPLVLLLILVTAPPFGRGVWQAQRDPWRVFKFGVRRRIFERAGGRCEAPAFLVWGRCSEAAAEADHVVPWSRGGKTVLANGQALCTAHNRSKGSARPPWWYVLGLERRRRRYFPADESPRVTAGFTQSDREQRSRAQEKASPPRTKTKNDAQSGRPAGGRTKERSRP